MKQQANKFRTLLAFSGKVVLLICCLSNISSFAQNNTATQQKPKSKNLVPNPSFEERKGKSNTITNAVPWKNVGTVDYYMKPEKRDTSRFKGAHTGTCYAGLRFQSEYKEYMYVKLTEPLERGQIYRFRMYVRLQGASTVTLKQLGVYFSDVVFDDRMNFDKEHQIDTSYSKGIAGTFGWIPIKGDYIAKGGEKYIIIGNFNLMKKDMVKVNKLNLFEFKEAYYYIDDISLKKRSTKLDSAAAYKFAMDNALPVFPEAVSPGESFNITNLQFENGTATLKSHSYKVLDKVVDVLNNHPFAEFQIIGYTDNSGSESANKKLSKERAKAVYDYLKSQDVINPISYKGMGSAQPIAPNDSEENKAKNRRVEFVMIKE